MRTYATVQKKATDTCPFCGGDCEIIRANISGILFIRCLNDACGMDLCFSGIEYDLEKTVARFHRRAK